MATQETENPLPATKNKIWILRTSIHCEGCKRKVKKILCRVHGVENVEIDIKQQKVTVTGNVDGDSLVKKLAKAGKNTELLPQKVEKKEKNSAQGKNKEKQIERESNEQKHQENGGAKREQSAEVKVEMVQNPAKTSDGGASTSGGSGGTAEDGGEVKSNESNDVGGSAKVTECPVKTGGSVEVAESKSEEKKPESSSAGAPPPVAEERGNNESKSGMTSEKSNSNSNSGGGFESGTSGKKKKKQGQNGNNECAKSSAATAACTGSEKHHVAGPAPISTPANHIPPRQHGYHDYPPPHHHYGPPPVYAVSYNTAYPTSSYSASYYTPPPPYSYAYSYPGQETQSPPLSDQDLYPRQPLDSFEMFSDENPNGCFIM